VVGRAIRAIEPLVHAREQRVLFTPPLEPVIASVDPERLGRVLRNLLNAS
jgi:signal transduction histidine kinase